MAHVRQLHHPASFTLLNFPVPDIGKVVDQLAAKGIKMDLPKS